MRIGRVGYIDKDISLTLAMLEMTRVVDVPLELGAVVTATQE